MCFNETLQRDTAPLYSGGHFATLSTVQTLHVPSVSGGHFATLSRHWWVHVPSVFGGSLCYTVQTLVGARTLCIGGHFATLSRHWWVHVPSVSGVNLLHCPDTGGCTYPLYRGSLCYTVQTLVGARTLCIGGHFATLSRHWWVHVPSVFGGSLCYTVQTLVGARTLCIRGSLCYTVQTLVGARTLCIRGVTLLHCPDTGGCTYPLYSGGHFATLSRHWWVHAPSVLGGSLCYTVQTLVSARTLCIRGVTLLHCPDTGGCTYPLYSGGHLVTLSRHW